MLVVVLWGYPARRYVMSSPREVVLVLGCLSGHPESTFQVREEAEAADMHSGTFVAFLWHVLLVVW
jgi:hypothetical protein